jgi:beta-galactosidase
MTTKRSPFHPELGVCYYPEQWPETQWEEDSQRMIEMGLSWVRIGEFAWSRLEPKPGEYQWGWLDRAIDILGKAGLKIVLGTPSATPPFWMVSRFPNMLGVGRDGQIRKFGSRRHYSFSHLGYRKAAAEMAEKLSERYGQNPYIRAWQVDNEYGCHDTTLSYDGSALQNYRGWLKEKYKNIQSLNEAWGNMFWSMEYPDFEAIDLPHQTVTEANPSHEMDFRRFTSDEVVAWNKSQVRALRTHSDYPIIHNYMGRILDFDHFDVGRDLDIASWDSYPLGFLEDRSDQDEGFKKAYARQGDPDFQAFHHDLYRAVGGGRWWVMEQQPGPVNWAPFNPAPLDDMVKLWTWEAIAHGAEVVSYFRWRQAPFAQEQMHSALLSTDAVDMPVVKEIEPLLDILKDLDPLATKPAKIAIVFDYASSWAWDIQPQGMSFNYFRLVLDLYSQLRKRGYSIDILPPDCDNFGKRDFVFIPGLLNWNTPLKKAMQNFQGKIILGPRSGSKTDNLSIPPATAPNLDAMPVKIRAVESLRPDSPVTLRGGGKALHWREFVQNKEADVLLSFEDDNPALLQKDNYFYLAAWYDAEAYSQLFEILNLSQEILPEGVRQRDIGNYSVLMNYNDQTQRVVFRGMNIDLLPAGVAIFGNQSGIFLEG